MTNIATLLVSAILFFSPSVHGRDACSSTLSKGSPYKQIVSRLRTKVPKGQVFFNRGDYKKAAKQNASLTYMPEFDYAITNKTIRAAIKGQQKADDQKIIADSIHYRVRVRGVEREAFLYYRILKKVKIIIVDEINVPDALKGQGISTYLFALMLHRNPETNGVFGLLGYDNRDIFVNAEGSLEEKFQVTPFLRSFRHLGFDTIAFADVYWSGLQPTPEVLLERSTD